MSSALRAATRLRPATTTLRPVTRAFSQSQAVKGGHGSSYDPPSGWLFGVKPGEKYEKEGWEGPMYYGFCGAMVFAVVAYAFKPDTRYVYKLDRRRQNSSRSIGKDYGRFEAARPVAEDESTSRGVGIAEAQTR
jgi:hypothetical protein